MPWEQLIAEQTTRFSVLVMDALRCCREAKKNVGKKEYRMADQLARDAVALWSRSIDLALGPLFAASPLLPYVHIDVANGETDGSAFLAQDITQDKVVLTDLGQLGGTATIKSTDIKHEISEGPILTVTLGTTPAKGLYQGFALRKSGGPIAVITARA